MSARPEVQWFAEQMEAALKRNDHKGGWLLCDRLWLQRRLLSKFRELCAEIRPEMVMREAADVANFAMMIADCSTPSTCFTVTVRCVKVKP